MDLSLVQEIVPKLVWYQRAIHHQEPLKCYDSTLRADGGVCWDLAAVIRKSFEINDLCSIDTFSPPFNTSMYDFLLTLGQNMKAHGRRCYRYSGPLIYYFSELDSLSDKGVETHEFCYYLPEDGNGYLFGSINIYEMGKVYVKQLTLLELSNNLDQMLKGDPESTIYEDLFGYKSGVTYTKEFCVRCSSATFYTPLCYLNSIVDIIAKDDNHMPVDCQYELHKLASVILSASYTQIKLSEQ